MLLKTHIMFAILAILLFVQHVNNKLVFILAVLVVSIIPDLDNSKSRYGRNIIFRVLQFFVRHRGFFHSFTFAIILAGLFAVFYPVASFGIFLGYSVHLLCDSFTIEGIEPFWPLKAKSSGFLHTGGRIEESLFFALIFINVLLFFFVYLFP